MGVYKNLLIEFCYSVTIGINDNAERERVYHFVMSQVLYGNELWCRYAERYIEKSGRLV